jgi:hypothetical protein
MKTVIIFCSMAAITLISACNNYGKKTTSGHVEAYYKDGITEQQANNACKLIRNIDVAGNNPLIEKSFQLCKQNDTTCFKVIVDKAGAAAVNDEDFLALSNAISDSVFNSAPVNMDLTDDEFKSIRTIHFKKLTIDNIENE